VSRPPAAPSGGAPPESATLPDGSVLDLKPLAQEIARRHRLEFPDEAERYGDSGLEWCVYDNQWLLSWAIMSAAGWVDFQAQLSWLAGILDSRGYPVHRLARDLELAAELITDALIPDPDTVRAILKSGADTVRASWGRDTPVRRLG
jgi:hypothetical protein